MHLAVEYLVDHDKRPGEFLRMSDLRGVSQIEEQVVQPVAILGARLLEQRPGQAGVGGRLELQSVLLKARLGERERLNLEDADNALPGRTEAWQLAHHPILDAGESRPQVRPDQVVPAAERIEQRRFGNS